MRTISVFNNVTLDGVMQAPADKNEDTRGGFRHGGWALPYDDSVKGSVAAEGMAILLIHPLVLGSGRRLFDDGGAFAKFRLAKSQPTTTGVVIATYELAQS